jgi:tungstate transport system permease protein
MLEGAREAGKLLLSLDRDLLGILGLSLLVSLVSVLVAMVLGLPVGVWLGRRRFRGRTAVVALVNTGMGLPPVVVGLVVFLLLARSGPLGFLDCLYTPWAMIAAQTILALPLVIGVSLAGVQSLDERLHWQILSLGASRWQYFWKLVVEARLALLAALAAAFGAVISEVGAVMMVGGNLKGETRVMTTAIVLETRQGHFGMAIALGLILLAVTLAINWAFTWLQQRRPG